MAYKVGKNTKTNGWQILKRKGTSWKVIGYKDTKKSAIRAIKKYE